MCWNAAVWFFGGTPKPLLRTKEVMKLEQRIAEWSADSTLYHRGSPKQLGAERGKIVRFTILPPTTEGVAV